jgi:hypothetical protein
MKATSFKKKNVIVFLILIFIIAIAIAVRTYSNKTHHLLENLYEGFDDATLQPSIDPALLTLGTVIFDSKISSEDKLMELESKDIQDADILQIINNPDLQAEEKIQSLQKYLLKTTSSLLQK